MTSSELNRVQSGERVYGLKLAGCLVIFGLIVTALGVGGGMIVSAVASLFGNRFHPVEWLLAGLVGICGFLVLAAFLFVYERLIRPWMRRRAIERERRTPDYDLVDEVHLWEPEFYISHDPVGFEVSGTHGSFRIYTEIYLLVVAPDRVLWFADHRRGDIAKQLTADGREDPYGAFPTECRMVFRVRGGDLLKFEALGPLRDADGTYRAAELRSSDVKADKLRDRRHRRVLRGTIERLTDLQEIDADLPEALASGTMGPPGSAA